MGLIDDLPSVATLAQRLNAEYAEGVRISGTGFVSGAQSGIAPGQ